MLGVEDIPNAEFLEEISKRQNAPKLVLKIKSGQQKTSHLEMTAQGLINGNRKMLDGFAFFGTKKKSLPDPKTGQIQILNDFVIKNTGQDGIRHRGQHVCLRYCPKLNNFLVRDLGTGYGTFSRVDTPTVLSSNTLISIGTSFLLIQIGQENSSRQSTGAFSDLTNFSTSSKNQLKIRVFGGTSNGKTFVLDPQTKRNAVMGRIDECDLIVEDSILSKKHCSFTYDASQQKWTVIDGFNLRSSLNGTWIYLSQEQPIRDNMTFRVSDILFQASTLNC